MADRIGQHCAVQDQWPAAFILRTDATQQGRGHHPKTVVEVAAEVRLRDLFGLSDGAEVELDFLR